jgi:glycosyltransferase involved in cell wall biosynthesis
VFFPRDNALKSPKHNNKFPAYVLVTAARDEAEHIEKTISSVASQTVPPRMWVIVSDGSADSTDEIVRRHAPENPFIKLVRRNADTSRDFASKVRAQLAGLEQLDSCDYGYLGFIDADVSFENDCMERILAEFGAEPKLGVAGGAAYEQRNGRFGPIFGNRPRSVGGLFQIFRRECFEQIEYVPLPYGGEDTVAEAYAAMNGWLVTAYPQLRIRHHKGPASLKQAIAANFKFGRRDYACRTHPAYELAKLVRRIRQRPYVIGAMLRAAGYCWSFLRRCPRDIPGDAAGFMRAQQLRRLGLGLFAGSGPRGGKPPRACIVAKYRYPMYSRLRQQARVLAEAGMDVDILCLRDGGRPAVERSGKITVYRVAGEKSRDGFLKYLRFTFCFAGAAFFRLNRLLVRQPPDVLVVHTLPEFMVFVGIVHKILGRPVVLDCVDLSVEVFESKWGEGRLAPLGPLVRLSEKLSCRFADRILTASAGFKERLLERSAEAGKVTVMMNSADTEVFRYDKKRRFKKIEKGARLFYHGTVARRFGLAEAVEAVGILQDRVPGTTLRIYGRQDPGYRELLQRKINRLNLGDRVFLGPLQPHEEIYRWIRRSDIGIVPYRNDDFMNLALSTKMFEYAAAGIPIVTSRLRPAESVFDDSCVAYTKPADPQDLADKIARLCLDPALRKSRVKAALAAQAGVSGAVMAGRFLDLVRGLLD